MNDDYMKKRIERVEIQGDETDWARVDAMTDEEALQNALDDPDNPPLAAVPKGRFKPVVRPQWIRRRLGMTQGEFAETFGFSLRSLQEWEQGRSQPNKAIRAYLRVISVDPEAVRRALKPHTPIPPA